MREINGLQCKQIEGSPSLQRRASRYMQPWGASERDKPGYWVKLTKRTYAYREHTGDISLWREA